MRQLARQAGAWLWQIAMTLPVDPARYSAFLVAMFVMAITPGRPNLFAIATGMQKGKARGAAGAWPA